MNITTTVSKLLLLPSTTGARRREVLCLSHEETQENGGIHYQRVNDLTNEMASVQDHNDGEKLANFTPPPQSIMNIKKDLRQGNIYIQGMGDKPVKMPPNPLQIKPQDIKQVCSLHLDTRKACLPMNPMSFYNRIASLSLHF